MKILKITQEKFDGQTKKGYASIFNPRRYIKARYKNDAQLLEEKYLQY